MIDEQKAIEVSKRFSAYHAHQVLSVSLENNGKLTAYRVRFGSTDEFPHVDIYVDAETAEVLEMRHYDLQTFE